MKRTLAIVLAAALVVVGAVLAYRYFGPWPDGSADGRVATVRRGKINASIDALGRVEPGLQLRLSTRSAGTVRRIHVHDGQQVDKGMLLLELDAQEHRDAVDQAERSVRIRKMQLEEALQAPSGSAIDLASARLRRATAARHNAQKDYDEIANQPDAESSDEALDLEVAKLEYEIAEAEFDRTMEGTPPLELARLRADLEEAEMALRQAKDRLEETRIHAPITGTIMRIDPVVGENVHGFAPVIWLADLSRLEIRAEIDEIDIPSAAEGQPVRIRLDAFPAHILEGEVVRIPPRVSETRGATTYEAIIDLVNLDSDGKPLPLRPGMGANLTLITRTVEDTLLVPRRAIRQLGRHEIVHVVEGRHEETVVVTLGLSNDAEVEILSGLEEGQRVLMD